MLALVLVHVAFLVHLAQWKLGGRTLSPLEPSEAGDTLELGYVNAGFVLLAVSLLATLVVGRFFCGWACHVVALQDLCQWLLGKIGLRPRPVRSRLLVWVPLIAGYRMFVHPSVLRFVEGVPGPRLSNHLMTDDLWARMPGWIEGGITFLVCGIVVVWVMGAKGFCTYGCPYGGLYALAGRFARGRVRVTDACEGCGHCTAACTSGVRVHEEVALHRRVVDPGCMRCLDCVSVCPKDALYYGFRAASGGFRAASGGSPQSGGTPARAQLATVRSHDFTWGEELFLAVVFAASVYGLNGFFEYRPAPFRYPFLLSLGLGTLTATAALALLRLARRRDFAWQHLVLRRSGRPTRAGWFAALVALLLVGGVAQQGLVRTFEHHGFAAFEEGRSIHQGTPDATAKRAAAFDRARGHLGRARRVRFTGSAPLEQVLGVLARHAGDAAAAEKHMARAVALAPEKPAYRIALTDLLLLRHDVFAAFEQLEELRLHAPDSNDALSRLGSILVLMPDFGPARCSAAEILIERGDLEGAANVLVPLLEADPPDDRARAIADLLDALRAPGEGQ